jgi:hypothetical protein
MQSAKAHHLVLSSDLKRLHEACLRNEAGKGRPEHDEEKGSQWLVFGQFRSKQE